MNRFEYMEARLLDSEDFVCKETNIKLYDGEEKTQFEDGELVLTTHRLFWGRPGQISQAARTLCLGLHYVISVNEESASSYLFGKKIRIIVYLAPPLPHKQPGPMDHSRNAYIKLSGKRGISTQFQMSLRETSNAKLWTINPRQMEQLNAVVTPQTSSAKQSRLPTRSGIGGIERVLEAKSREMNDHIALAFKDLNVLMAMAKDMITVSKVISDKIRDHHGNISDDETVRFKSYLLSLGISDPVTRDGFNSNTDYYEKMAAQVGGMLSEPIKEIGGMMSLADVYCRVNRARGFELLSPEDLLHACEQINGDLKLRSFPSGAAVLQLSTQQDDEVALETFDAVVATQSVAVEELAQQLGISLLLAKERLLSAERLGKVCRDECVSGLRFYPNYFLLSRNEQ